LKNLQQVSLETAQEKVPDASTPTGTRPKGVGLSILREAKKPRKIKASLSPAWRRFMASHKTVILVFLFSLL
jgi:hypothetical protein